MAPRAHAWWLAVLAAAAVGCGDDDGVTAEPLPDSGAEAATDSGSASARDSGATSDAGQAPDATSGSSDAGPPFELEVEVVVWRGSLYPLEGALVRVDNASGGTRTETTDADGVARFELPADSGPWTVTAAKPDFTVTSIVGVTGPLGAPIHLGGRGAQEFPRGSTLRALSGAVSGIGGPDHNLVIGGPLGDQMIDVTAGTYSGTFQDFTDAPPLRLLAVDWMEGPVNGVWVEVERTGADLTGVDIVFPTPPRSTSTADMTLSLPTTGAIRADGFVPVLDSDWVAERRENGHRYMVGHSLLDPPVVDGTGGWRVEALDGDMAPTHALFDLGDPAIARDGNRLGVGELEHVLLTAEVEDGAVIDVPAAEELDRFGSALGDLSLTVMASEYAHAGASVTATGGQFWFLYTYEGATLDMDGWPELPWGMSFADLEADDPVGRLNLFCLSYDGGTLPWNWSQLGGLKALLVSDDVGLPIE